MERSLDQCKDAFPEFVGGDGGITGFLSVVALDNDPTTVKGLGEIDDEEGDGDQRGGFGSEG